MKRRLSGADQFALGVLWAVFAMCLVQDWYGRDAYIQHARDNWHTLPWGVWVIPLMGIIIVRAIWGEKR